MRIEKAYPGQTVQLGRRGEHKARKIVFDLSEWVSLYGAGKAELIFQRYGDPRPTIQVIEQTGNQATWLVTDWATEVANPGKLELRWYVDDIIVKSQTWATAVSGSLDTPSSVTPSSPEKGWVDRVVQAGATAKTAATAAQNAEFAASAYAKQAATSEANATAAEGLASGYADAAAFSAHESAMYQTVAYQNAQRAEDAAARAEAAGGGGSPDAVLYTPQTLTESQKAQARENIGIKDDGKWERIECICFGYEWVTEQPADWSTNKTAYFYPHPNSSKMTAVESWRSFVEIPVFRHTGEFDPETVEIIRTEEPDGTPYNLRSIVMFAHIYNTEKPGLWCPDVYFGGNNNSDKSVGCVATLPVNSASHPYHFACKITPEFGTYDLLCFSGGQGDKTTVTGVSNARTTAIVKPISDGNITRIKMGIYAAKQYYGEGDYIEIWGVRA